MTLLHTREYIHTARKIHDAREKKNTNSITLNIGQLLYYKIVLQIKLEKLMPYWSACG